MKNANAGKQRKFLAAQVLCGLLLGAYLTGGYSMPAAWAVDSANVDASNVAGYTVQWGAAIGTGTIAASNNQLVTGGTVYSSVNAKLDKTTFETAKGQIESALQSANTRIAAIEDADFGSSITELDEKKLDKTTFEAAKTQISDALTDNSARIKAIEDEDFGKSINELEDKKADKTAIGATADGTYVKESNNVGENLNALDTQLASVAGGSAADIAVANARISSLDGKVEKVGAGAAALAALHPLDTDSKFGIAAGFGNYRSANAMAMGLFYRPTDKVMFSLGGAMGNGENLMNVGVTFALDKGVTTSKAAMARKIAAQDEKIATLEGQNAEQKAEIQALKEALARLEAKIGK